MQLLEEMALVGHPPSVIAYSAAISACGKGGAWEQVCEGHRP